MDYDLENARISTAATETFFCSNQHPQVVDTLRTTLFAGTSNDRTDSMWVSEQSELLWCTNPALNI
jgi:hypothetical protein